MTASRHYELLCDHEGCVLTFNAGEKRADVTRAAAAQVGWVHGVIPPAPRQGGPAKSLDYCAVHRADLGDARPKALPAHATVLHGKS